LRFFLDQDVSVAVAKALRADGHECWTASEARLGGEADDALTVYASDRRAVLVTHDREFSQRRRRNVVGWPVYLRCYEWEASKLLLAHLNEIERVINRRPDVFMAISVSGCELSYGWK
jgi:predicted nuclease of predicted toxin-antitoxin system